MLNSLKQTDKCKCAETFLFKMLHDCYYPFPKVADHKISTTIEPKVKRKWVLE